MEKKMSEEERAALLRELNRLLDSGLCREIARKKLIGVYGLGGAGCNILHSLYSMGLKEMKNVETIAINSDERIMKYLKDVDKRVLIRNGLITQPSGTAGVPGTARKMVEAAKESLEVMVSQHQILVLLGSLGGVTGLGLMIALSSIGIEQGKAVIAMPVLPFSAEGIRRRRAERALKTLEATGAIVTPLDNESLVRDERFRNMKIHEALEALNRIIFRKIREIQDDTLKSIVDAIVDEMYAKLNLREVYGGFPEMETQEVVVSVPAQSITGLVTATSNPISEEQAKKDVPEIDPKSL